MAPPLKLGHTTVGYGPRSFVEQMELDQIDGNTFLSTAGSPGSFKIPYKGGMRTRSYGGLVYAQAAWAAAQTVAKGFVLHSISGYFVSAGWADVPFVFRVKVVRDGKSYVIRYVEVTQMDTDGLCFSCTCSFKKAESSVVADDKDSQVTGLDIQDQVAPDERYKEFLRGMKPQDCGELVFDDEISFHQNQERGWTTSLPTTKIGMLPMDEYNDKRHPLDRRALYYYTIPGRIAPVEESPNLHICNHLFMADQYAVALIAKHFGVRQNTKTFASLSTMIVFHCGAEPLAMVDKDGNERWFCQEAWTDRIADGRGTHRSRIWDDTGRHVATTMQDAQLRLAFESKEDFESVKAEIESKPKI